MRTFQDYFRNTEKSYVFVVKLAEEVDNDQISAFENALGKYELLSVTRPRKAIIQVNPRDFPNVQNAEIYTMEAKVRYPVAAFEVQHMAAAALGISEKHVVVFCEGDPNRAIEEELMEKEQETYTPVLTSDYEDSDHQELTGDKRRESLLKELEKNKENVANFAAKPTHEFAPDDFLKAPGNNQSPINGTSAKKVAKKVSGL